MLSLGALGVLSTLQQPHLTPDGRTSHGGRHLDQHPSAGKLISPLQRCWWQDSGGQQVPEQQLPRGQAKSRVPQQQLPLAEATAAPGGGLALCPQPGGLGWPLMPCSSPDLQTHSAPHAVWVIQAHKGVIKIHSKLMSATSVLMSMAERHSRSGWRTLISPLQFANRVGSAGRDGDWGAVAGGSVWCHTAHTDRTPSLIPAHKHFTGVLPDSLSPWLAISGMLSASIPAGEPA